MTEFRTHYDNLKISRNASSSNIRAAYKALMQKYHPDKFDGTVQEALRISKIIHHSYDVLIDPKKRAIHDRWINKHEAKFKNKYSPTELGPTEFDLTVKYSNTPDFYNHPFNQNFYTEEELYRVNERYWGVKKKRVADKDYRIYYSGLMVAAAIVLFLIGMSYHSSILMLISAILLFFQPAYLVYIVCSRIIKTFYE